MEFAAELVELMLEHAQVEIELRHQREHRKVIASRRRLDLTAMRTKERGLVVRNRARPAFNRYCRIDDFQHWKTPARLKTYDENDDPQPQERVEFGLMKLKPCRISVSS